MKAKRERMEGRKSRRKKGNAFFSVVLLELDFSSTAPCPESFHSVKNTFWGHVLLWGGRYKCRCHL